MKNKGITKKLAFIAVFAGIITIASGSIIAPGRSLIGPAQVPDIKLKPNGNPSGLHLDFGSLPLYFTANKGQVDGRALFYAKAARYTLWLTEEGLVFDSFKSEHAEAPAPGKEPSLQPEKREDRKYERDVSRLVFLNASKHPQIVPVDETALKVNYFIGNDRAKWHTAVPTSEAVLYKNIYDRIDLKVYGTEGRIEYDWIVRPGGNPSDIKFEYRNVKGTRVDEAGNLLIKTEFGELMHKKPAAYQEGVGERSLQGRSGNGTRATVESAFKKIGENAYGFEIGAYEAELDLVIDPVVLAYSSYLGGSGDDVGRGIAVDNSGNAYVTGETASTNFPTLNQYQTDQTSWDVFVTKIDTTQSGNASLVYSTYLGGSGGDYGYGIAVDGSGNAYVTGYTYSTDFPILNQYQTDPGDGLADVFVTKIDTTQSGNASLVYSTYLGGSSSDYGYGIAVDGSGNAYMTGYTDSTNFSTLNQYQADQAGRDAFITKISRFALATVTTTAISSIATDSAQGGGNVTADNGSVVTARGVCWNITGAPTTGNSKTIDGAGTGAFTSSITGLLPNVTYHVRAYATNAVGTSYGAEVDFTTLCLASVTTQAVTAISTTTATGHGSITDFGSGAPTQYGVCWNTTGNPTTADNKTAQGAALATGPFTSPMTGLDPGTTYHVKAYATNNAGTAYGGDVEFTTVPVYTISGTVAEGTKAILWASVRFSHDGHVEETDINGRYAYAVPRGTTTTVTPSHASYSSWTPASRTITNITSDQPNQDFQGTPKMYRISGRATDGTNLVAGVTITFSFYGHTETTAADGTYSYLVPPNSSTLITPSKTGYSSWTPAVRELTNITSDQPNQDFQGTNLTAPRMTLAQGQTTLPKGGTYDYGTQMVNAGSQAVFTINNSGGSDLTLQTNLVINGANADQFRVVQAPTSPVAAGQSTTFTIEFKATSGGQKTASIPLVNNDPANNPYDLNLTGKGKTSLAFGYAGSWTGADHGGEPWYIGDFNGDGKTDIFRYWGASGADMFLSNGAQFVASGSWTPAGHGVDGWYVGDFNGDGKTDIFRYRGASGADMFLSNGAQFVYSGSWTPAGHGTDGWYIGDFNGDGKSDLCRVMPGSTDVFLSTGASFLYAGSWTTTVPGPDGWYVGDFDGDGKSDICRVGAAATEVFLSTGTSFVSAGSWTTMDPGLDGWYVGDFNGDGKTDIFRYGGASGADVFLPDGSAFVYSGSWTPAGHGPEPWYIGNFDGTGGDDIFRSLPGVSGADVFLSNSALPGSLTESEPDHPALDEPLPSGTYREMSYAEETRLLAPFIARILRGEEVSIFEIKKAYEEALGRNVRKAAVNQLLSRHDFWKIIKGRAFGSPLARDL